MEDYIDVLSDRGLRTGEILTRSEIHRLGKPHRAVHLYIFNSKNEILLQRRSMTTDHLPGVFGISVTGHVIAGDTSFSTIKRELREELGIDLTNQDIKFIFSFYQEAILNETYIDKQFNDVYIAQIDIDVNLIIFDFNEVSEVKFVSFEYFKEIVLNNSGEIAPYYIDECQDLFYFLENTPLHKL